MKIQHLRFFAAVVECGGVVKAARRLRVSQPAISAGLKALEQELGQPLFERPGGGRRLVPTSRAPRFYQHALEILRRCDAARAEFRAKEDRPPRLRLGILATIASRDIAAATLLLDRPAANWRLQIWEGADPARLANWLRQGRIDVAWTVIDAKASNIRTLWREPFVAFVAPSHPLARRRRSKVMLKDLDGEPLVLRSACELKEGELREAGVSMRIAAKVERDDLALRLVAQGVGIAIAPRSLATGDIVALPVADLGLDRSIGLKWRPDLPQEMVATVLDAMSSLRTNGAAL